MTARTNHALRDSERQKCGGKQRLLVGMKEHSIQELDAGFAQVGFARAAGPSTWKPGIREGVWRAHHGKIARCGA
jgi:hypothetical protein